MGVARSADLVDLSAVDLAGLLASRQISAREAVASHLERAQQLEPKLHALAVPLFDEALRAADDADRRGPQGRPLHGLPITVKECFDVRGTPSTMGASARAGDRAQQDAELVTGLRAAGAIVVGKTNVSQLLLYVEADNPLHGRSNNPWKLDRSPGGSSGGEGAAVAAGYSVLGLGSDIGGSVRVPAHFCGVTSLKPTPGVLTLTGAANWRVFQGYAVEDTAGLLARTVGDLRLAMGALGAPASERSASGLRVGVYEDDGYFPASASIRRAVRDAAAELEAAGCQVQPFTVPGINEALRIFYAAMTFDGGDGPRGFMRGSRYDPRIKDLLRLASLGNPMRGPIAAGYRLMGQHRIAQLVQDSGRRSTQGVERLRAELAAYRRRFLESMAELDVLICPPCSTPAVTHGATRALAPASANYTMLFNVVAWPAGVVPVSRVWEDEETGRKPSRDKVDESARTIDRGSRGLPVGVQVAARPGREDIVLGVMAELERRFRGRADYPNTPLTPA